MKNKTQIDEFQEIVEVYFKNILKLPCPDFRDNLFRLQNEKLNLYKNMIKQIVIEDVPHQYQNRLLELLN